MAKRGRKRGIPGLDGRNRLTSRNTLELGFLTEAEAIAVKMQKSMGRPASPKPVTIRRFSWEKDT